MLDRIIISLIFFFVNLGVSGSVSAQDPLDEPDLKSATLSLTENTIDSSENSSLKTGIYSQSNGTDILIDKGASLVVNIPIIQHSSYRKFSGYYYEPYDITYPPGFYGDQIASSQIANLNGDQYPDAVIMTMGTYQINEYSEEKDALNPERVPRVHFLINKGNGQFENGDHLIKSNIDRVYSYKQVMVGDLNNDGLDDILTPTEGGGISLVRDEGILVLMSQPDGSYIDATSLIDFPRTYTNRGDFSEEVMQLRTSIIIPVDVNDDGWNDIFTVGITTPEAGYGFPNVLFNNQGKSFTPWDRHQGGDLGLFSLGDLGYLRGGQRADFDKDGLDDVVLMCYIQCFNSTSEYAQFKSGIVFLNDNGDFNKNRRIPLPLGLFGENSKYDSLDVGDINNDGYPDIIFAMGKADPYYAGRSIQILINDQGRGFIDETSSRIDNIRTDFNGHAEGNVHLIDYDRDGDLDIFDFQDNVREGYATHSSEGLDDQRVYPYWESGVAIFLNDGNGIFEYLEDDFLLLKELYTELPEDEVWRLDAFRSPYKVLPIDFGNEYGIGFVLGAFLWQTPSYMHSDSVQTSSIATARKLNRFDNFSNEELDTDGDGVGNQADTDDDGDGIADFADAFPLDARESLDTDGDGIGNNRDIDDDSDGVIDFNDVFPLDVTEARDTDGDGIGNNADNDDDNDGYSDPHELEMGSDPLDFSNMPRSGGLSPAQLRVISQEVIKNDGGD